MVSGNLSDSWNFIGRCFGLADVLLQFFNFYCPSRLRILIFLIIKIALKTLTQEKKQKQFQFIILIKYIFCYSGLIKNNNWIKTKI